MATPIEKLYSIRLGVQGENATTPIEIDMTSWLEEFPTARLHIMFKRYNDNYPYPVITEFDHPILRWIPTVTDTEYIGVGYAEILALDPETDLVKKSRVVPTAVENSVTGAYGQLPVPSPFENWVNQVLAAKDTVEAVADNIEASTEAAEAAQAAAEAARDAAQAAAGDFQGLSATASGLTAGAAPTVNVTHNEGGLYNLAFGIPKGDKGDQGDPAPAEQVTPAVDAYLAENFTNPSSPPLDRSLSSELSAAPADMVGDLKSALSANGIATLITDEWITGKRMGTPDVGETFTDNPVLISSWQYIKLPCNPGDVFTINATGSSTFRTWAFADSALKCLARDPLVSSASVSENEIITAPATAAWLYINQNSSKGDCYFGKYTKSEISELKATDYWRNKTIVFFGDSRTWYDGHNYLSTCKEEWAGKTCVGYQAQVVRLLAANAVNCGGSSDTSPIICDRVREYDFTGADAVFLAGGVNDFVRSSLDVETGELMPIGSEFDTETSYGAWQSAIEYILTNYPEVQIFMDVPPIAWTSKGVYPYNLATVKSNIAELYNIPCVDLYKDCGFNEVNRDYYYADDVSQTGWRLHFNDYGNEVVGLTVAKFIEAHYTQRPIPSLDEVNAAITVLGTRIDALGTPIDTKQNYAPIIPALIPGSEDPNDLDLYMTPGTFRVTTSEIAQALLHCPASISGRLIVMNLSETSAKLQIYLATNGSIFVRKGTSGSGYTATWSTLATAADVAAVSSALTSAVDALGTPFATRQAYTTVIQPGDDLNDYTTPGNYRVTTISVAKSLSNIPVPKAGRFTVLNTSEQNAKMQVYFANNDGIYFRMYTAAAGYKEWYKLSTNKDIPTDDSGNSNASRGAYNLAMAMAKQMTYDLAFANAFTPIPLKNYVGNTENVHPKVLYFENGFGSHKYWMAYTPYPGSNDDYENPCIAYSDDGYAWTNYADNPLDTSENPSNYNSDTHLVYREDTATLECWYRFVDEVSTPKKEIIYRRTTTDGVTWTAREVVTEHEGAVTRYLSPAVIWDNTNKVYHIWAVHGSAYGGSVGITYFTADENDLSEWVEVRDYALSFDDEGMTVNPWHLDVIKDGTTYIMLIMCRNGQTVKNNRCSLFISTSSDNITYSTPEKVVGGADNWDKFMYRSSIVKVDDIYRIYYSAGTGGKTNIYGRGSKWGLGITESSGLNHFYGCFE